jgi:uncharacterized membrane protein (UPF0127 family)
LKEGLFLRLLSLFSDKRYRHAYAKIGRLSLDMEVADDSYKRAKGLMYRKNMRKDSGMLFIFDSERRYSFWMLNMQFSIDLIWLDRNMRVVDITKEALPSNSIFSSKSYSPKAPAMYVIEACSGFASYSKLKPGNKIKINFK